MNNTDKISAIKKAIELKTGKCEVSKTQQGLIKFTYHVNNMLNGFFQIDPEILNVLPIAEPLPSEEWIPVSTPPELTEPLMWYNEDNVHEVMMENYRATVLAYNPVLGIYKAEFSKMGWSEISSISTRAIKETIPTFWQPLPNPPKAQ